jgi:hypothetical protein
MDELEARLAPALLTVNTLADETSADDFLSLREAIGVVDTGSTGGLSAAELGQISGSLGDNDTIQFASGLTGTITLTSGELAITRDLALAGPGASQLSVSANAASRIFAISGVTVGIAGLTLANGQADQGGAIQLVGSTLILQADILANNLALNSSTMGFQAPGGGAVEAVASSTLTVTNCLFTGDRVTAAAGLSANGGAIFSDSSTLTIDGSVFQGDEAIGGTGVTGASGGALYALYTQTSISNSAFEGNRVAGGAAGGSAYGGAVTQASRLQDSLTLTNTSLVNNQAVGGSVGGPAQSGAVDNDEGTVSVSNCRLLDNWAIGGSGGDGVSTVGFGQGGAITSFGELDVDHSVLSGNQAMSGMLAPGGIPNFNTGSGGAAIAIYGTVFGHPNGVLNLTDSTLAGNQAIAGGGASGVAGSVADGGALAVLGGVTGTVSHCTFLDNSIIGGAGGSGATGGAGVGGAIDLGLDSTLTVTDSTFVGNQAVGGAGGAGASGGLAAGGGIEVGSGVLYGMVPDTSALTLQDDTLIANSAQGGQGGLSSTGGNGEGGGLVVLAGTATVSTTGFTGNVAAGGLGGLGGNGGAGLGGGAFVNLDAHLSLAACQVTQNLALGAAGSGGGSSGQGIGGGVYNLGTFDFDSFTVIAGNFASTSNDDLFP